MSKDEGLQSQGWFETRMVPAVLAAAVAGDLVLSACGGVRQPAATPVDTHIGYDVSHTQCKTDGHTETSDIKALPGPASFAVVGLTGGQAAADNPFLTKLFHWAEGSSGEASQPKVSFYVNTAAPGPVSEGQPVQNWPTTGTNKVGVCTPQVPLSNACAYQYGINTANKDLARLPHGSAADAPIWLDVEKSGTTWLPDQELNIVVLEGVTHTFVKAGHKTGIYSSPSAWSEITGGLPITDASSLYGLDSWMSGESDAASAKAQCGKAGFAGGKIVMAQIQQAGKIDQDYACE